MKQAPDLQKAQGNMKPGVISLEGFLGKDSRNLIDILTEDDAEVKRMDLTHEAIAARMEELRESGMAGLGEFTRVDPHYEVRVDSVRGKLPCPFGHPGIFQKTNITVRNLRIRREIIYSDLHIHLIKAHGFYEGKGSVFRLEPKDLVATLEIAAKEG
ncbi:MAG: hypothetical protein AB1798_08365 [Spirochaetota bacterium]